MLRLYNKDVGARSADDPRTPRNIGDCSIGSGGFRGDPGSAHPEGSRRSLDPHGGPDHPPCIRHGMGRRRGGGRSAAPGRGRPAGGVHALPGPDRRAGGGGAVRLCRPVHGIRLGLCDARDRGPSPPLHAPGVDQGHRRGGYQMPVLHRDGSAGMAGRRHLPAPSAAACPIDCLLRSGHVHPIRYSQHHQQHRNRMSRGANSIHIGGARVRGQGRLRMARRGRRRRGSALRREDRCLGDRPPGGRRMRGDPDDPNDTVHSPRGAVTGDGPGHRRPAGIACAPLARCSSHGRTSSIWSRRGR